MTTHRETIDVATKGDRDMTDITSQVEAVVGRSGVETGLCHVFNLGSTGIISTIEFEPGLESDFPEVLHKLIPPSRSYGHEQTWRDGNGHSHLQASLAGPEITLPVENGSLSVGTWQQVFHYEADVKPRRREIIVTVMGD